MLWNLKFKRRFPKGLPMKRHKGKGRSAFRGNAPSPYTKKKKKPYKYDIDAMDRNHRRATELGMTYLEFMTKRWQGRDTGESGKERTLRG